MPPAAQGESQRFRLVVMASDVSRGCLRRLPWDYGCYGCPPGEQAVADAVRASMSIPFFEPVLLRDRETGKDSTLVDGEMLSNFPVDVFDAHGREPRWPTFGIKLSAKAKSVEGTICDVHGPVTMAKAMVKTMSSFYDRLHIDQPSVQDRTIFGDTGKIQAIEGLTVTVLQSARRAAVVAPGLAAAVLLLPTSAAATPTLPLGCTFDSGVTACVVSSSGSSARSAPRAQGAKTATS